MGSDDGKGAAQTDQDLSPDEYDISGVVASSVHDQAHSNCTDGNAKELRIFVAVGDALNGASKKAKCTERNTKGVQEERYKTRRAPQHRQQRECRFIARYASTLLTIVLRRPRLDDVDIRAVVGGLNVRREVIEEIDEDTTDEGPVHDTLGHKRIRCLEARRSVSIGFKLQVI